MAYRNSTLTPRFKRCLTPLLRLTDCDSRIEFDMGECGNSASGCGSVPTSLVLEQAGCPEYETVVEQVTCTNRGFGCDNDCLPPQIIERQVEKPKASITYPLHEFDGRLAIFILDGKLKTFGYGRYKAWLLFEDCEPQEFDIDYRCVTKPVMTVTTGKTTNAGGERC